MIGSRRGNPKMKIEEKKTCKTKRNPNGTYVARLVWNPREGVVDLLLVIIHIKTKEVLYEKIIGASDNHYYAFRLLLGNIVWVSLYTVAVWDQQGTKIIEYGVVQKKEQYLKKGKSKQKIKSNIYQKG